jgi:hypothetical protein
MEKLIISRHFNVEPRWILGAYVHICGRDQQPTIADVDIIFADSVYWDVGLTPGEDNGLAGARWVAKVLVTRELVWRRRFQSPWQNLGIPFVRRIVAEALGI